MKLVLENTALAGSTISRNTQYKFDENGLTTASNVEDIKMLIENGCRMIELEDDYMNTNLGLLDFNRLVGRGADSDRELEQELSKVIREDWRVVLAHEGKVLLTK